MRKLRVLVAAVAMVPDVDVDVQQKSDAGADVQQVPDADA